MVLCHAVMEVVSDDVSPPNTVILKEGLVCAVPLSLLFLLCVFEVLFMLCVRYVCFV